MPPSREAREGAVHTGEAAQPLRGSALVPREQPAGPENDDDGQPPAPQRDGAARAFLGLGGRCGIQRRGHAGGSEEHTSELQSPCNLVCRLLLEKQINTRSQPCWTGADDDQIVKGLVRVCFELDLLGNLVAVVVVQLRPVGENYAWQFLRAEVPD